LRAVHSPFLEGAGSALKGPRVVIILSDGIRGHVNQSRGVALWMGRLSGASALELEVPRLSGVARFMALKLHSRRLPTAGKESARRWLEESGGAALMDKLSSVFGERGLAGPDTLFLSTGSTAAPYSLALSRLIGARSATVMTPSVLGTAPFDFAIVPVHDSPEPADNLFLSLGAPNAIDDGKLPGEAETLFSAFPSKSSLRWGVLIGGDDANYRISPGWIRKRIGTLAEKAVEEKADLYVTTSRRTTPEAERALSALAARIPVFRMVLLASKDPSNPVPGILGGCREIFCTEDSVSMVSEAATAGFVVRLLRVGRKAGLKRIMQSGTTWLVENKVLPRRFLWGAPRFDAMLEGFKEKGLASDAMPWDQPAQNIENPEAEKFNEARDAAAWIIREWNNKGGDIR